MPIKKDEVTEIPRVPIIWTLVISALVIATVITDIVFGTSTNVIIFFMTTIILPIMIIVVNTVGVKNFFDALGFDVKQKYMYIIYISIGVIVGFGIYYLFARPMSMLNLLPLPLGYIFYQSMLLDLNVSPTLSFLGGAIYFMMVAISEEVMRKFCADAFSTKFAGVKGLDRVTVIFLGFMAGSVIWAASHLGSYTIAQSAPFMSYVMAYMLGLIFIVPGLLGFMLKGTKYEFKEYVIIPAIVAHFLYDFLIFTHYTLSFVAPTSLLAYLI